MINYDDSIMKNFYFKMSNEDESWSEVQKKW